MSTTQVGGSGATADANVATVDMKLEAVVIPVADVDRAKEFYGGLGWRLDADFAFDNGFRVVQLTPPGSGCSVQFGTNITSAAPGSAQGLYLIVSDIEAARDALGAHGVRGQRGVPPRDAGRPVPARRHERPRQRAGARARQLQLLRHVQRPGRQRLAAAGDHGPPPRPDRRRSDDVRVHGRPGQRAPAGGGRPRRARAAHRRARRQLAGLVRHVHGRGAVGRASCRRDGAPQAADRRLTGSCRRGRGRGCRGRGRAPRGRVRRPADRPGSVRSGRGRRASREGSRSTWWA